MFSSIYYCDLSNLRLYKWLFHLNKTSMGFFPSLSMKAPARQPDWHHLVCLGVLLMPGATHRSPVVHTPTVLWLQRVMNHSHRKGYHQQTTSSHVCPRPAAQHAGWNHWVGKHRGGHKQIAISHSPQRARQRQGQTGRSLANLSMSLISLRPYITKAHFLVTISVFLLYFPNNYSPT